MKLLSAEVVKTKKSQSLEELSARVKRLQAEEKRLIKHISDLAEKEEKERVRIESDLTLVRNEAELEIQKSILFQEVRHLEDRKNKALEPINETTHKADKLLKEAQATVADAQKYAAKVKESHELLSERIEQCVARESLARERHRELDKREAGIEAAEQELKRSTAALADKWVLYHEEVHKTKAEVERREKEVRDGQKANEVHKERLDAVAQEQARLKIGIKDGYESLKRAKQEILINK